MNEPLITLPQAAVLLGMTYACVYNNFMRNADGFPVAVSYGHKNIPLYRKADFLAWKAQRGIRAKGIDNVLALALLTGKLGWQFHNGSRHYAH